MRGSGRKLPVSDPLWDLLGCVDALEGAWDRFGQTMTAPARGSIIRRRIEELIASRDRFRRSGREVISIEPSKPE